MSQLDEKGKEAYRNFLLDNKKLGIQTDQFDQSSWLKQRGQDITTRGQDMVSADKAASRAVTQRAQQAKQQGLKGIDAVTKAITAPAKSSKTTVPAGWDVTFQVLDPDTGEPTGDTKKINLPDKRKNPDPTAYKFVSAQPATRSKATTSGGGPLTAKQWDTYYRSLRAQNPGKDGAIRAYLGARPKK